jgi:hypothetical protein
VDTALGTGVGADASVGSKEGADVGEADHAPAIGVGVGTSDGTGLGAIEQLKRNSGSFAPPQYPPAFTTMLRAPEHPSIETSSEEEHVPEHETLAV